MKADSRRYATRMIVRFMSSPFTENSFPHGPIASITVWIATRPTTTAAVIIVPRNPHRNAAARTTKMKNRKKGLPTPLLTNVKVAVHRMSMLCRNSPSRGASLVARSTNTSTITLYRA
jgi:hypothetical protein